MNRSQLIEFIYEHSREEFIYLDDVFELAKESEKQLRNRVVSISNYLAGKYD